MEVRGREHARSASHERGDRNLCDERGAAQTLLLFRRTEGKGHLLGHRFRHIYQNVWVTLVRDPGDKLGDRSDEIGPDVHIEMFVSRGPTFYAYKAVNDRTRERKTICKVRENTQLRLWFERQFRKHHKHDTARHWHRRHQRSHG